MATCRRKCVIPTRKPEGPKISSYVRTEPGTAAGRATTNVWRLYKASDLHHPRVQVSIHDDGVGTRDFVED